MGYRLVLSNLKILELQFLVTVDNNVSCHMTCGFSEMTPGQNMLFDLSMFDI